VTQPVNVFDHDESFGHMLGITSRAMINILQKKFTASGHDITVEQWTLLINIGNAGGQFQQQIAQQVYRDKGTVARLADGLERKMLIRRISDAHDRRQKRVVITEQGRTLLETLQPLAFDVQRTILKNLERDRLNDCREVLLSIYKNILKEMD